MSSGLLQISVTQRLHHFPKAGNHEIRNDSLREYSEITRESALTAAERFSNLEDCGCARSTAC